jgi:hypothetical protein
MTEEADSHGMTEKRISEHYQRVVLSHERRAVDQNRGAKLTSWGADS